VIDEIEQAVDGIDGMPRRRAGALLEEHTGGCELHDGKVAGIAVSSARGSPTSPAPGEVLVSSTVGDLVAGSGLASRIAAGRS
jgi:hypothetical protein